MSGSYKIITIDGPSGAGKSTVAKLIADKLGFKYLDTGAMYRAVTWYCIENNIVQNDVLAVDKLVSLMPNICVEFYRTGDGSVHTKLNGKDVEKEIRGMLVSQYVSKVSALRFVREAMVTLQQKMGEQKGIVMDGRDIGTVVFPQAELKIFVTADARIRAKRRYDELIAKGEVVCFHQLIFH